MKRPLTPPWPKKNLNQLGCEMYLPEPAPAVPAQTEPAGDHLARMMHPELADLSLPPAPDFRHVAYAVQEDRYVLIRVRDESRSMLAINSPKRVIDQFTLDRISQLDDATFPGLSIGHRLIDAGWMPFREQPGADLAGGWKIVLSRSRYSIPVQVIAGSRAEAQIEGKTP